jgi:hypothetical protein
MSNTLPKVSTSTQASADKTADREPKNADSNAQAAAQAASENPPENAIITPLIGDELNPAFVLNCQLNHPKAFGKKGWKETQLAITGHKGPLSDAEKTHVEKVFELLKKHSKRDATAYVDDSDVAEIRTNKRIFDDRNHTAERITDIRCIRGIEYQS